MNNCWNDEAMFVHSANESNCCKQIVITKMFFSFFSIHEKLETHTISQSDIIVHLKCSFILCVDSIARRSVVGAQVVGHLSQTSLFIHHVNIHFPHICRLFRLDLFYFLFLFLFCILYFVFCGRIENCFTTPDVTIFVYTNAN